MINFKEEKNITIFEHPLIQHKISILRDKETGTNEFRKLVEEIAMLEGFEAMEKLLKSEDCPTGIYCANDITAVGMLKCLQRCRNLYFTPSIIASDDIEEAQYTKPMLTTVGLPKEEMGRFALYLLLDRMKGGHSGVVRMELSGKLLVRNSCSHISESFWSDYCI